jgi:hypothetical protein
VFSKVIPGSLACFWFVVGVGADVDAETIHVKVLVDEEEPMVKEAWQQRLQRRVDMASEIVAQYCDLRFSVTCFDTWATDNRTREFTRSLREFEQEVSPAPAQIAIGFTSQYQFQRGRNSLGGTRGPLHSHILIREGASSIYETERVEVVVHELGHFLGAAHSARKDSVMRSILGDGQSRSRSFRVAFDPDNAQVIRLVAGEVIDFRVRRFLQLSPETRLRLKTRYQALAQEYPDDPVARKYVALIDHSLQGDSINSDVGGLDRPPPSLRIPNPTPHRGSAPNSSGRPR